jgi:hypothetical protein
MTDKIPTADRSAGDPQRRITSATAIGTNALKDEPPEYADALKKCGGSMRLY